MGGSFHLNRRRRLVLDHHSNQTVQVNAPRSRVAAYVLRRRRTWELLVFNQAGNPQAGTQIPAGGVRRSETPDEAVMREVQEETGLTQVCCALNS